MFSKLNRVMLLSLIGLLVACENNTSDAPTPTVVQPTVIVDTPLPTETRLPNPTLPPVTTIEMTTAPIEPTRTLAETITPAPTRTSSVSSLQITPVTDEPLLNNEDETSSQGQDITPNPQVRISYEGDLLSLLPTAAQDGVSFTADNNTLTVTFPVQVGSADPVPVSASLNLLVADGRLTLAVNEATVDGEPIPSTYQPLLQAFETQLQDALDEAVLDAGASLFGEGTPFTIVEFEVTGNQLVLELAR